MAERPLTPHFAALAAHQAAGITEQSDDAVAKPLHPAEFERRYGTLPAYVEKSLSSLTGTLTAAGVDAETAPATAAEILPLGAMERVLVGTPAGTEARYVDTRPEPARRAGSELLADTLVAAAVARATTTQELEKVMGGQPIYSQESFSALRHASIEKGMRPSEADDFVEKSRQGLTKKTLTDRNGHSVSRWVKTGAPAPAAPDAGAHHAKVAHHKAERDKHLAGAKSARTSDERNDHEYEADQHQQRVQHHQDAADKAQKASNH